MTTPRFCFVFVCQHGPLEARAVLLAASLRRFLPASLTVDLVAAQPMPEARWGCPSNATLNALDELGVRVAPVVNRIADDYPTGNKFDCLAVPTRAPTTLFLDSDMLMLRAPEEPELTALERPLAAVPASLAHAGDAEWQRIYTRCELPLPEASLRLLQSGELSRPYFNAGMVASRDAARLADVWAETARFIDSDPGLPLALRRPWLDQLALPVAAARLGWQVTPLDAAWNHPSWAWPSPDVPLPLLYHYQGAERFLEARRMHAVARQLAWANPRVAEVLAEDAAFHPVLAHGWLMRKVARRVIREVRTRLGRAA